jgi:FMN phosphatase YigB (HAD superfamily)
MRVKAIPFDLDGTIFDILERDAFARYKALNERARTQNFYKRVLTQADFQRWSKDKE